MKDMYYRIYDVKIQDSEDESGDPRPIEDVPVPPIPPVKFV
jgi:hypothetical protein